MVIKNFCFYFPRRIVDFISYITSPSRVALYIRKTREAVWPGGELKASPQQDREQHHKLLSQVTAFALFFLPYFELKL